MPTPLDGLFQLFRSFISAIYQLIVSIRIFPEQSLVDPGVLLVVVSVSLLGILLLLRLVSRSHRQRYNKLFRSSFLVGSLLGLVVPWNQDIGLVRRSVWTGRASVRTGEANVFGEGSRKASQWSHTFERGLDE